MFGLFSKSKSKAVPFDFSAVAVDMHSHVLPGIDDGAKDLASSIELIRGLHELGYRRLVATPHVLWDMYRNTPASINHSLKMVQDEIAAQGIDISITAAAEYFLDEHVEELLANKEPLLAISGNRVLVEFSMAFPSLNIKDLIFEMQMQGYQPIIAHPERYVYLQRNKEFYQELKDMECLFQLNLLSLTGHYGKSVNELAQYLLKNNFYNMVGTDLHHSGHLAQLQHLPANPLLTPLLESGHIINNQL